MHPVLFQLGSFVVPSYGVAAAVGVLLALWLAQFTARRVGSGAGAEPGTGFDPRHSWNILILAVFAALVVSRLLLILMNLSDLRRHPRWLMAVAMVHHPLLAGAGVAGATIAVLIYIRWAKLPLFTVTDALAAPLSVGIAAEQVGALLAGSGFGRESTAGWAVTYTSALASRWSGAPLGIPLHPVQAYAALGSLTIAALTIVLLSSPQSLWNRRRGDITGVWLIANGALLFVTEIFRDWEGRGVMLGGSVDAPQLVALGMVLMGGLLLMDWHRVTQSRVRKVTHV